MSNGRLTHEDFKRIESVDLKLDILFETIQANHSEQLDKCFCRANECAGKFEEFNKRVGILEKRKRFDTGISASAGVIGGVLAFIGKWFFFK